MHNPKTSFEHTLKSVGLINQVFGNQFGTVYHDDIPALAKYIAGQLSLVEEESKELIDATNEAEWLDAIGDIITVVDGIPFKAGLRVDADVFNSLLHFDEHIFVDMEKLIELFMKEKITVLEDVICPINDFDETGKCYESNIGRLFYEVWSYWRGQRLQVELTCLNMGFDPRKVYDEVHASNMSKTCSNLGEVLETIRKYEEKHSLKYVGGDDDMTGRFLEAQPESDLMVQQVAGVYVVKANRDIVMNGKPVKAGKFLKGIKFKEPDFSDPSKFKL